MHVKEDISSNRSNDQDPTRRNETARQIVGTLGSYMTL
jgi:hypothetical protein